MARRQKSTTMKQNGFSLELWGPSSAGKTVMLIQLFLEGRGGDSPWEVRPAMQDHSFIQKSRSAMESERRFPPPTLQESPEPLQFDFYRREDGVRAHLRVEDRAGALYTNLYENPELVKRLATADGLVLLIDPACDKSTLRAEVEDALLALCNARDKETWKDSRPVSVCVSKADTWINSPDQLDLAISQPDRHAREYLDEKHPGMVKLIEQHFEYAMFYPLSAVGVYQEFGTLSAGAYLDGELKGRLLPERRPFNVMEPFTDLIEVLSEEVL